MIPLAAQPVACVALTKEVLNDILSNEYFINNAFIVSPTGNIFILGENDDFDIIDYDDKYHLQYIIKDAAGVERRILFEGEVSNYGIMVNTEGICRNTTRIAADPTDEESVEFFKWETGELGQEPEIEIGETIEDEDE